MLRSLLISSLLLTTIFFGFCCAAQNYTLPSCAQVCSDTAATASGCYTSSNATCLCASQPFQSAIQTCFGTNCNTTDQGTAWQYYSNLCTSGLENANSSLTGSITSTISGMSTTITLSTRNSSTTTSTHTGTTTSSTQTSSSTGSTSVSSSISSSITSMPTSSSSGALGRDIDIKMMLGGVMGIIVGGLCLAI